MKKYLLDSVILIDHFNNISQATDFIKQNYQSCCISAITRAEVLVGFDEIEKPSVIAILDKFELLVIDKKIADMTALFRKTYRTKLPDALQASVAICHNLTLVSRNTKDFKENQSYLGKENLVLCPYVLSP